MTAALLPAAVLLSLTLGTEQPTVRVGEMKIVDTKPTFEAPKQVFDPENQLRLTLAAPPLPSEDSEVLEGFIAITDAAKEGASALLELPGTGSLALVQRAAGSVLRANEAIRESFGEEVADSLLDNAALAGGTAIDIYSRYFASIRRLATDHQKRFTEQMDARQSRVSVTVVHERSLRRDRTYPSSLTELLQVTDAERELAGKLRPDSLHALARAAARKIAVEMVAYVQATINPPLQRLRDQAEENRDVLERMIARVEGLKRLETATPADVLDELLAVLHQTSADVQTLQVPESALRDLLDAVAKASRELPGTFLGLIRGVTGIGQVSEIAREVRKVVLAPGGSKTLTIGTPATLPATDFQLSLRNGDAVSIVVVSETDTNGPEEELIYKKKLRTFKRGLRWVRTIAYDFYEKIDGTRVNQGPVVNFLAKLNVGDNEFWNTWGSVGFGISWFFLGVDQTDESAPQRAAGPVVSLLDDWVNVGYARNFDSNHWFVFGGMRVPLPF